MRSSKGSILRNPIEAEELGTSPPLYSIIFLIVSHDVPRDYDEFRSVMWGFVGFGVTFFALICIWYNNYLFHRRYGLEDSYTIFLNSLLIFLVLFYIYPLKFLAQILINFGVLHSGFGIDMNVGFIGGFDYYNIFIIYFCHFILSFSTTSI